MGVRVPMRETAFVTLDGSGAGTAKIGPVSAREVWHPENVAVSAVSPLVPPVAEAQCAIYVGNDATTQTHFRDATVNGTTGDNTDKCNADVIRCGHKVWAVWSGGDANSRACLTVTGTKEV
jgi:hypothetical protein